MAIEHNTIVDDVGKKTLPEGHSLASDRGKTAERVFDKPKDWKDYGTNKSDLKGFDTKRAKEGKLARGIAWEQGEGYVKQEADRFMRQDQDSYRRLQRFKDKFYDYDSFKKVLKEAWSGDNSLHGLVAGKQTYENDFEALFDHPTVQGWLQNNIKELAIPVIQKKYNIERGRATQVWDRLSAQKRGKVLTRILHGKRIKIKGKKSRVVPTLKKGKVNLIKVNRSGKVYRRTKSRTWTQKEINLLRNNQNRGVKWVQEWYNRVFYENSRTESSIANKYYRLKKEKK